MKALSHQPFTSMIAEVGRLVNDTSAGRQTAIKEALNSKLDIAGSFHDWPDMVRADTNGFRTWDDTTLKTLVSGEAEAPMPYAADEVVGLMYQEGEVNRGIKLVTNQSFFQQAGSSLTTEGRPKIATRIGRTAQHKRCSAVSPMEATSNSTNAGLVARVYYDNTLGAADHTKWEDVSSADIKNSPAVLSASGRPGWPIEMVSLPAAWESQFRVTATNGGGIILNIEGTEKPATNANDEAQIVSRALWQFWPVPDTDYSLTVLYKLRPRRLYEDEDVPEIPVSSFMVYAAASDIAATMGKSRESALWREMAREALNAAITDATPDEVALAEPLCPGFDSGTGTGHGYFGY
jgi:hypothetical protein